MTTMEIWGLIQAVLMLNVIILNGLGHRVGWITGAAAQAVMVVFGYGFFGAETFLFLVIPMAGFVFNWLRHPMREQRRKAVIINEYRAGEQKRADIRKKYMPDSIGSPLGMPVMHSPFVTPDTVIVMNPQTAANLYKKEPTEPVVPFTPILDPDLQARMNAQTEKWIADWIKEYSQPFQKGTVELFNERGEQLYNKDDAWFRFNAPLDSRSNTQAEQEEHIAHPEEGTGDKPESAP